MSYRLNLLDKSPIYTNESAIDAFQTSIRFAKTAELHGYHRLWYAEHHGAAGLAGSAPEILAAYVLARTNRIRIGTGGILLQHYSPFKVAEVFNVLSALAPGRVDIGIGKAPGGLPAATRALQAKHGGVQALFDRQLADLDAFLDGTPPDGHPLAAAPAITTVPAKLARFVLGASPDSALVAAHLGWNFAYAGHFNGDPGNIERSFEAFRSAAGRNPILAVYAFAAGSAAKAREAVSHVRVFRLTLPDGKKLNVGSVEQAAEFARQAGVAEYQVEETSPHVIAGTPDDVHAELAELSGRFGVDEFVIDTPVAEPADRIASIELIGRRRAIVAA